MLNQECRCSRRPIVALTYFFSFFFSPLAAVANSDLTQCTYIYRSGQASKGRRVQVVGRGGSLLLMSDGA